MSSSGEEKSGPTTPKKAKKLHYKQKFRDEWLKEDSFKSWLQRDPKDPYRAFCKLCDANLLADKGAIKRHSEGNKHLQKSKPISSQKSIATVFQTQKFNSVEDKRKTAEIKLAGFIAEHKISHRVMDHLIDLLPSVFPDSEIAKNLKMKRTKLQAVINNILGAAEKQDLCADIKTKKISVMIDESTDIGSVKTMCIVVRYYCQVKGQIISRFWDLIQIHGVDSNSTAAATATAEHLFEALIKSFQENSVPIENIIGFGSDGCNTMMGCHNSVSSRFRVKCPGIIVLKCVCHSLHLCASDACKQLPADCEKLTRDIYNFFATSSKRQTQFKEFQVFTETDIHKILKPAQTRWLSLDSVVDRILEQWNALTLFFNGRWLEDNECAQIHNQLNDPAIKTYFFFLNWMLPKFTKANTIFQSETPMVTKINKTMNDLYYELLSLYMKRTCITEIGIDKIDPTDEKYFQRLEDMYLGLGVQKQFATGKITLEKQKEIKIICRNFLIKACVGIRKRYALNDPVLVAVSKLELDSCLDDSTHREETLQNLFTLLPRLAPSSLKEQQELDDQWRKLPRLKAEADLNERLDVFWHKVKQNEEFSMIAQYMLNVLALPNSNAECERVFSKINDMKTKKRNKLITNTIKGNMLAIQAISRQNADCVSFKPTETMLKLFNSKMYNNEAATELSDSD